MAAKLKTWVWVVLGIAAVCILFVIALAGVGIYFFTQNIQTTRTSPAMATQEFDAVRARFTGPPLIELDARGNLLRSHADREAPHGTPRPETLHVMAFDRDDGGLVKMTIPFWLLRMQMDDAAVNFGDGRMTLEDLKLTVQDLDRLGPALVLDHADAGGDRVLVWSQ